MGCCEVNGIRNRLEQINPYKQQRDYSAPICKKPIFDDNSTSQYKSESQYYSYKTHQFRVSKSPNKLNEFNTNQFKYQSQYSPIQHRIQTQQAVSCPPIRQQYLSNQSFSVPVSNQLQQTQYVINNQPQQQQQQQSQTYMIYPQSNNISFRGDYDVNQILNNLNNQQQKLFKSTSKAILKVEDDKLSNNDREIMQDIFHKLEKTSCFNSKKSSKSNLSGCMQKNSKELKTMYNQMNNQLQLLNKLIVCLDDKLNLQDSKQVKQQLREFSEKVKELGEMTLNNSLIEQQDKSFRSYESSFLPKTNNTQTKEIDFSNLSEQEDSQIKQMKDIMQQYRNQSNEQQQNGLLQRDLNKINLNKITINNNKIKRQNNKLSSERMKENNQKIDSLINKLHHLNQSYKLLYNE